MPARLRNAGLEPRPPLSVHSQKPDRPEREEREEHEGEDGERQHRHRRQRTANDILHLHIGDLRRGEQADADGWGDQLQLEPICCTRCIQGCRPSSEIRSVNRQVNRRRSDEVDAILRKMVLEKQQRSVA